MSSFLKLGPNVAFSEDTHPFQIRMRNGQLRYYKTASSVLLFIRKENKRRKPRVTAISWGYKHSDAKDASSFEKPSLTQYQKWILYDHFDARHKTIPEVVTTNIKDIPCFVLYLPIQRPVKFLNFDDFTTYIRACYNTKQPI